MLILDHYFYLVLHGLNYLKVVKTTVFGPLFQVNFENVPFMEEVITIIVFL